MHGMLAALGIAKGRSFVERDRAEQVGRRIGRQVEPGRGWFCLYRFYGPTQRFFDGAYKPGDFVKVDG